MPPVEQRVVCIDSKADKESKSKCCQRQWIVMLSIAIGGKNFVVCVCAIKK